MNLQLVVFDMAGTTVDEDNIVYKTLQEAIVSHKFSVSLEQVLQYGAGKEKLQAIIDVLSNTGAKASSETTDLIFAYFNKKLAENYLNLDVKAFPDVERVFMELKSNNIKVALNTGYNRITAEFLIQKLGWKLGHQFDVLVTASDVKRNRPHPDMILLAMSQLNIHSPEMVIKVGDSTVDIQEGQNAGCALTIGVTSGAHSRNQLREADPDYVIDNLYEMIGIIEHMKNQK